MLTVVETIIYGTFIFCFLGILIYSAITAVHVVKVDQKLSKIIKILSEDDEDNIDDPEG
jgi:hypothetical protein